MILIPAVLLAFSLENADVYHLPKFLILAIGALVLLWNKPVYRTSLDRPIAVFLAVLTTVSIFSQDFLVNLIGQYQFYFSGIMPWLVLTGLFYAFVDEDQDRLVRTFVWSMVVVSIIGIAQKWGYFAPFELPWGRVYSTVGSPVFLSCLLAMAVSLGLYQKCYLALPVLGYCLILTQSRAGHLAAGIGCLIVLFRSLEIEPGWPRRALFGFLAVLTLAGMFHATRARPMGHTDKGRYHMARVSWKAFKDHPIAGYGSELFFKATTQYRDAAFDRDLGESYNNCYAHNQFIHALAFTGIPGFLALLYLLFSISRIAISNTALLASGAAIFVYSMFQPTPLHAKAIYAMFLGSAFFPTQENNKFMSISLKVLLAAIVIYLSILFSADRLRKVSGRAQSPYLWNQSVIMFPTVFR